MKRICILLFVVMLAEALLSSCGGKNTGSNVGTLGNKKAGKDKLLEAGADMLQDKTPLKLFNTYLDGFHFYNGNIHAQMEAHHYVSQLNNDVYQAVIFDGNGKDAKLMGVEYIITAELFEALPEEEKKLWHSHHYEVKSGTLIAPGIPAAAEHELMEKLISTYGKTIHTWHTDQQQRLPLGAPIVMMGFTKDGQIHPKLVNDRDKRFDVSTAEKKKQRANIAVPRIDSIANSWEKGHLRQFLISDRVDSALHKH